MVRPFLEYSAVVWDPHLEKDKAVIENVQRRAARYATGNYSERSTGCIERMLQELNWEKLEQRRKTLRLAFLHKINNNLVDISIDNFTKRSDSRTRGSQRFQQIHIKNPVYFNSFFPRTLREWNKLPPSLTSMESTDVFRDCLGGTTSTRLTPHHWWK